MKRSLNHSGRGWPTLLVLGYTLLGWPIGVWMLMRPEIWANVMGVVLAAHSLIYSAYMIHDCVHHAIFSTACANDRLGILMSWMNGACVASYAGVRAGGGIDDARHDRGGGVFIGRP